MMDSTLLEDAARRAGAYLAGVGERRVWPTAEAVAALAALDEPLPDEPEEPLAVLELLDRVGTPATVTTQGGRFFGFVTGSAQPAALAASWMVSAWDQNAALRVMSPMAAAFEDVALGWLRDLLGLPVESVERW